MKTHSAKNLIILLLNQHLGLSIPEATQPLSKCGRGFSLNPVGGGF